MFKNYLTVALRNILRDKSFAFINISGLAVGIAAALLIFQYVQFERSFDRFHANADRVFRVKQDRFEKGALSTEWAAGAYAVGNHMKDAFGEVEAYVKMREIDEFIAEAGDKQVQVEDGFYAGPEFFNIFSFPLLSGDPKQVLTEPYTAVISGSLARKLFGATDPLGQTLQYNRTRTYRITGVYADFPENSHLQADFIASFSTFARMVNPDNKPDRSPDNAWNWDGCLTYLLLKPNTDAKALEAKFPAFLVQTHPDKEQVSTSLSYSLQPLPAIHLYSHYMGEVGASGNGNAVYILLGAALFIIVIAWVNYVNLATARAIRRAREVGVRKAVGSFRGQLISQFLTESALLNALAVVSALLLALLSLPFINKLTGQQLSPASFASAGLWATLGLLFVLGTLFSGAYPAFVLSGFKPVEVLKGGAVALRQKATLRKALVVVQFAASGVLLIGTIVVFRQVQYMRQQALGIDIEQTVVLKTPTIRTDSTFAAQAEAFKTRLLQEPGVRSVTLSSVAPGEVVDWNAGGIKVVGAPDDESQQYRVIAVDYDYIPAYGLKILAGRPFDRNFGEKDGVIFNRTALRQLGFDKPDEAVGKKIEFWGDQLDLVGVVEDFHQQSLQETIEPLILRLRPGSNGKMSVKTTTENLPQTLATLQQTWTQFFPGNPFEYKFLDQQFDKQYKADRDFGLIFGIFSSLAILVACLGLFGLASFTTAQRRKEIGIRKVLGASVAGIVGELARDFLKLVLVAIILAAPVAWFLMQRWLEDFAYRIDLQWWMFAAAGLAAVLIAFLTVSLQSIRAALMNPVTSLRSE